MLPKSPCRLLSVACIFGFKNRELLSIRVPRPTWKVRVTSATNQRCQGAMSSTIAQGRETQCHFPQQRASCQHTLRQTQPVDYTTLVAVASELRSKLCPSKVEQVLQVQDEVVLLKVRTVSSTAWIQLSWHSTTGHIATLDALPERGAAAEAYSFGAQLHTALRGLILSGVELPQAWERVVRLDFAIRLAEPPQQQLHCEIMGRYSNVVLTDGSGIVSAAGYQVGGKMSSLRHVQTGKQYHLPPPAPGIDPDSCASLQQWQKVILQAAQLKAASGRRGTVLDGCVRAFRGVSPSLVWELCHVACIDATAPAEALLDEQWCALYAQWKLWLQRVKSHSFATSSCPQTGFYSVLGTYPQREDSILSVLGQYYTGVQTREQFVQMKQRLQKVVSQALQRLAKKVEALQRQGGQGDKHLHTQKLADLIMANAYRCSPGMSSVQVEDWDSPGSTHVIPLDPRQTAVEAAETLYRQARKQRRAVDQVAPLLDEAQAQLEYMTEVELMLSQIEEGVGDATGIMGTLREVQAELVAGGYMKPPPDAALAVKAAAKARRAQKQAVATGSLSLGYREYLSPGSFKVLIGRNSRQNDELTMRVAKGGDVWMHARGVPGAHVVLRVPDGQEPGDDDIQFAADLAAWFSKARTEGKAEVICAHPRNIKKPKGSKPGQVLVTREQVVVGRPSRCVAAAEGEL